MASKAEYQENNKQKPRTPFPKGLKFDKTSKRYAATLPKEMRRGYIRSQCGLIAAEMTKVKRGAKSAADNLAE